jgi:hypothetical protein
MRLLRYKNAFESPEDAIERRTQRNTVGLEINKLESEMKPLYADFKQQVEVIFADLSDKEYGISVDEKGELIIINNKNDFNSMNHNKIY